MKPSELFAPDEVKTIVEAIRRAERHTSAEIRVHVENRCPGEVLDRAVAVFDRLEMRRTERRNGVLIYVALKDRRAAMIGDENVNRLVHREFWLERVAGMGGHFARGSFAEGIREAVEALQSKLEMHFPHHSNDVNELPDDISFGED
jgi:uncharacterized membrane protein